MSNADHAHITSPSESYWLDSVDMPVFPELTGNSKTDVTVVGGGISGIMTAYFLTQKGHKVTLLEADRILNGTTGHTTAKLTAQHSIIYSEIIETMGQDIARLYYEANMEAVDWARKLVEEKGIDCNFTNEKAYIYAEDAKQKRKIEEEARAYDELKINGGLIHDVPLAIKNEGAVVMNNQAQYHPVKFLRPLIEEIVAAGGTIHEKTKVTDVKEGENPTVITESGHEVVGDYLAICSHYPFYDKKGFYFARLKPYRSYTIAAKIKKDYPGGMYISAGTPNHSLTSVNRNGEKLVLIGGYSHTAGQQEDTKANYEKLYQFGEELLGIEEVPYHWSAQDPSTLDDVPYIGKYSNAGDNVFIATGYRKWGMSTGIVAGRVLTDLITEKESKYEEVFNPSRMNKQAVKKFMKENTNVAKEMVKGKVSNPSKHFEDLKMHEGRAVEFDDQRAGAYRDEQGNLHIVDTTCTHMGCETAWNNAERTWDCPCHGSRFSYDGEVLEGPATKPLERLDQEV